MPHSVAAFTERTGLPPRALTALRGRLLRWYGAHQRELPWRGISDPYCTWVSEIMLQQTRVAAVLEHYERFLRRFPSPEALARAPESAVLAVWSGLGYYRRARLLHRAAREIVRQREGVFPITAAEWQQLPGIGRYTAAAIASIAFAEPVAVVDGNVERILRRLFELNGSSPRGLWDVAEHLLCHENPGDFNQAMMELGATICLPVTPLCPQCPIARWCRVGQAPRLSATKAEAAVPSEKRHRRAIAYALALRNGCLRLRRRPDSESLMPGMWELPPAAGGNLRPAAVFRHSITTTDYRVRVVKAASRGGEWVPLHRLSRLPLTGLTRKILRHFRIIQ